MPRAPLSATKLASVSRSSRTSANEPACSRLWPSKRYRVGSATAALAARLVEEQGGGGADVERRSAAGERDADGTVARPPDERPETSTVGAEDESEAAGEVGVPHLRRRVGGGGDHLEPGPLRLGEVAGEARDHRDPEVLDRARRGPADGRRDAGGALGRQDDPRRPRSL